MPYIHQYAGNSSNYADASKPLTSFGMISQEKMRREKESDIKDQELAASSFNKADKREHDYDMAGRQLKLEGMMAASRRQAGLIGALGDAGSGLLNAYGDKKRLQGFLDRRDAALGGGGGGILPEFNPGEAPWGSYPGEY